MQNNQTQNMMQVLNGRPVSSAEEARASMISMDGSLFLFPDLANKTIHTKQIMLDGTADFKTYVLVEEPKQNNVQNMQKKESEYVLRQDFESTIELLANKIKDLEGKKNVTSISGNGAAVDAE